MAYQHGCTLASERASPSSTCGDLPAGGTSGRRLSSPLEPPPTSPSSSGWTVDADPAAVSDVDADEHGPWCVDDGVSIVCMSTRQVWMGLAAGRLDPKVKVWRDGRGYWQPIEEIPQLTYVPGSGRLAAELVDEVPEIAEVLVRRQQSGVIADEDEEDELPTLPLPPRPRRRPRFTDRAWPVVAGLLLGVILALAAMHLPTTAAADPAAPADPRLSTG